MVYPEEKMCFGVMKSAVLIRMSQNESLNFPVYRFADESA